MIKCLYSVCRANAAWRAVALVLAVFCALPDAQAVTGGDWVQTSNLAGSAVRQAASTNASVTCLMKPGDRAHLTGSATSNGGYSWYRIDGFAPGPSAACGGSTTGWIAVTGNVSTGSAPVPTLNSVSPAQITQGSNYQTVSLSGSNFTSIAYHSFSIDSGANWFWASDPPTGVNSGGMSVAVNNQTARTVLLRVCASNGSTACSTNRVAVTINAVTYQLSVSKAGVGTGTVTGTNINCGGSCSASYTSGTSVTMNAAKSVTATFNAIPVAQYQLTVSKAGAGTGTVMGTNINCGGSCSASYTSGTSVTLTAATGINSTFAGWSGACSGTGSCTVTMSAAKSVTATFNANPVAQYQLTVSKAGVGTGTVTGTNINCGSSCNASYASGTSVTLTAAPGSNSAFAGWGGACSGTGSCTVTMSAAKSVTATFNSTVAQYTVGVERSGAGSGSVIGSSIDCGTTCSRSYPSGTTVTLTARADAGSRFIGWAGGVCSGVGVCTLYRSPLRSASTVVTAEFQSDFAYNGNWNVPFLKQRDDPDIGESACGPTSVAMLLRFYFPNSNVNLQEIYHSGTQEYSYRGPASSYRNVSFMRPNNIGLDRVPEAARSFFTGNDSGMVIDKMRNYLKRTWGVELGDALNEDAVYRDIQKGPLLGHVYGHGFGHYNAQTKKGPWGHFVVIRGIDTKGTLDRSDDIVYINDPYDVWNASWDTPGKNKAIPYNVFFRAHDAIRGCADCYDPWFRDAFSLTPDERSVDERANVIVVDTGHNNVEGNTRSQRLDLDDPSRWKLYVGNGGDYYYPNDGETNRAARWTPQIVRAGRYEVSVRFKADSFSARTVTYAVFTPSRSTTVPLVSAVVDQYAAEGTTEKDAWRSIVISNSAYLESGSDIRATGVAAGTNIDAIKLRRISD